MTVQRRTRRVVRDDPGYDMAFSAGEYAYQNEVLRAQLEDARQRLAPPPLRRRIVGWFWSIVIFGGGFFVFFLVGQASILFSSTPQTTMGQSPPLGTADVRARPPPPQRDSAPASVPLFADATPEPAYDNVAYNATAQASKDILIVVTPTEENRWADGEFWTDEEKAAFAATDVAVARATTDAFISDIPTPAPDVVIEMEQKCADAALVARSPLLQLWCTPEDL